MLPQNALQSLQGGSLGFETGLGSLPGGVGSVEVDVFEVHVNQEVVLVPERPLDFGPGGQGLVQLVHRDAAEDGLGGRVPHVQPGAGARALRTHVQILPDPCPDEGIAEIVGCQHGDSSGFQRGIGRASGL
jgi:hypothetical protein